MRRVGQPVLPFLPAEARSVGPSAGLLEGPDGGVVFVFGLVTYTYAVDDTAGRRLAAVQLVTTKAASVVEVASAFGVNPGTVWRWKTAFTDEGVLGLAAERPGPKGPSKLTDAVRARIVELDAAGSTLTSIAEQTGVSTATVRVALGRVEPRGAQAVEPVELADAEPDSLEQPDGEYPGEHGVGSNTDTIDTIDTIDNTVGLEVLTRPVPRTLERAAARFGLLNPGLLT